MEQIGGGATTAFADGEPDEWMIVDVEGEDMILQRSESEAARNAKQADDHIMLAITDKTGKTLHYKSRPSARLDKAFNHYASARGLKVDKLRFYHDGKQLDRHDKAAVAVSIPVSHL